jgi:hypothetical protein
MYNSYPNIGFSSITPVCLQLSLELVNMQQLLGVSWDGL